MKGKKKFEIFGMPLGIILPMMIEICAAIVLIVITIIQLVSNMKIVDYYLLLFLEVGCCGLMHTSYAVFKNWK